MNSKTIIATCTTGLLVLAACGGSSDSSEGDSGDVEAFCDVLREAESQEEVDLSEDFDAGMAQLKEFRDGAPSEVRGDIDVLIGKFEELNALEAASTGDEEEDFAAAFAIILDPEFITASENLEAFGVDTCGLDPSSTDTDDGFTVENLDDGGVDDGPVEASPSEDGLIREAANVPDPLFDPLFDSDVVDPNVVSIDGAAYFLDVNYTASPWRTRLSSWSVGGSGTDVDFAVGGTDISAGDAAEICNAVSDYLTSLSAGGSISVTTFVQNDDGTFGDESEVLSGSTSGGC